MGHHANTALGVFCAVFMVAVFAAPSHARQSANTTQNNALQRQQIDPEQLRRAQLSQDQLTRLNQAISTRDDPAADQAERDAQGRPLRPIDWATAQRDLSAQLQRQARAQTFTTAAAPVQTAPRALPRNVEVGEMARPRLPVLLPETADAFTRADLTERGMLVFPRDDFYSATYHFDGLMFEISGSRIVAAEIADPLALRRLRALRGEGGLAVTETETGLTGEFPRYGAAYAIDVHCIEPDADIRCRDPETVRDVARRLVIAGGSPDGEYPDPETPR